jgi:hypothetical protein
MGKMKYSGGGDWGMPHDIALISTIAVSWHSLSSVVSLRFGCDYRRSSDILLAGIAVGSFTVDARIKSGHDGRIGDRSLEWHTRSEFMSLREMHF